MKTKPSRQVQRARSRAGLSTTPQRQRGAAAVFAAVALIAMITAMLLAINVGALYYAQRDLQKQAALAAIAGAEISSGCLNGGVPGGLTAVTAKVTANLVNNANGDQGAAALLTGINGAPAVQLGWVNGDSGASVTDDSGNTFSVPADGSIHFLTLTKSEGDSHINAVRVNLSKASPSLFGSGFFPGAAPITLKASATAKQQAIAAFGLGTSLVTLNNGLLNQILGALLGTNVNLSLVSYQGLAKARVSLGNLMIAANVTDLHDLLSLQTTLPGALQIVGNALSLSGDATSGLAGGLVTGLAGQSYSSPGPTQNYFGQIFNNLGGSLNPTVTDALALAPFIDGVNLLEALGQAARKGGTISLPVTAGLPLGLGGVGVFLTILEPEKFAVGPAGYDPIGDTNGRPLTSAQESQVVVQVRLLVDVLGLATVKIAVDAKAANGLSILTNVTCPSAASPVATAQIQTTTSLLTVTVGTFTGLATANPPVDPSSGALVSVPLLLSINATKGSSSYPGTTVTQTGSAPFPDSLPDIPSATPLSTAVGSLLSSNLSITVLSLLNVPVGNVLSAILTPITSLLDAILAPLLQTLGIGLGVSSVTLESIPTNMPIVVNTAMPGTAGS